MRSLRAYLWLFALMTLSGLFLTFLYVPNAAPFGQTALAPHDEIAGSVLRGIHFWGAQLTVLAILVYVARVIFVKTNRSHISWAVALALLTALLWFTGIVLPWDQLAFWMQNWLHGISARNALLIVYWVHILFLPVLTLPLLMRHIRRFRGQRAI